MKLHLTILISSCLIISANSFGQKKWKQKLLDSTTVEAGAIPPDFSFDDTLGIVNQLNRLGDKMAMKVVKKNFNGKYALVHLFDVESNGNGGYLLVPVKGAEEKMKKYKYVLWYEVISGTSNSTSISPNSKGMVQSVSTLSYKYFILDTKTGKEYKQNIKSVSFQELVEAYMQELERMRLKAK